MDLFHENLAKWTLTAPEEIHSMAMLEALNPPLSVIFCQTTNGMPNLMVGTPQFPCYLHSQEDPLAEAKEWFASLSLNQIQALYVYGIGLGYYYEAAKDWLKEDNDRYLIFIEDDPEVMRCFMETERCREMLDNPQVFIRLLGPRSEQIPQFTSLTSLFNFLNHTFTALKSYTETKPALFSEFKSTVSFLSTMHQMFFSESAGHGLVFFRNFFLNFLDLPRSHFANGLLGKFKGVPAIICGAGPSLNKNIDVLSTLTDRALIFAGGTALNALNGKGVMPHFGVGIDPNPNQFTRLVMNHAFELPFLYRCRMLHEALEMVHGDRLYLTGSGGYEVGKWFEKQLGVNEPELPEGFNVLNFSVVIAHAMGCNPIICAGIDLAYSGGDSYAAGVASHAIHNRKSHFRTKDSEDELISKNDIYGKPVHTLWKWMAESLWYSHFAESHPECRLINATEGGIGFENVENMPLAEVKQKYLGKQWDLKTRLHGEIQNSPLPQKFNDKEITTLIRSLMESLSKCGDSCHSILKVISSEIEHPLKDDGKLEKIGQEESLLFKEMAYDVVLKRFNDDYLKRRELDFKRLENDKGLISEEEYARKKAVLDFDRYHFLHETALLNASVANMLLQRHEQQETAVHDNKRMQESLRQQYPIPTPNADEEYFFDKNHFRIKDPELQLDYAEIFPDGQEPAQESLFYPSQKMKLETWYLNDSLHGPSTFYDENGTILCRAWFVQGKQEGKMWTYHADGSLHSLQMFDKGLPIGLHQYFYPNGLPKSILPYKQGVLHGEVRLYHSTGMLVRQLSFVDGKRTGPECIWSDEGQLLIACQYEADRPFGLTRVWHANGVLAKEIVYGEDFNPIETKEWDTDGVLIEMDEDSDYFDQMNTETHKLTASLSRMVQEMSVLTPLMSEKIKSDVPPVLKANDLSVELAKLQEEMQYLQSLDTLLKEQLSQEEETKEAIWKTPTFRRELEEQFEAMKDKINTDLGKIGKGIKKIVGTLNKDTKDDSDNRDNSDNNDKSHTH